MNYSNYQQAIFKGIQEEKCSLQVVAVAGSGKTTTILEAAKLVPSSLFLAYNKGIAEAVSAKGLQASTIHSMGYKSLARKGYKVNDRKMQNILRYKVLGLESPIEEQLKEYYEIQRYFSRMASLLKGEGVFTSKGITEELVDRLAEHHSLDREHNDIKTLQEMFYYNAEGKTIDFDDMLQAGDNLTIYPTVFIDESQDLNRAQRLFLSRIARRIISVGDPCQAIYGFRGASPDSMERIAEEFNCKQLPLSICYRCSKAVVRAAQRLQPQIEASPTAEEGTVEELTLRQLPHFLRGDCMVVCRTTAPLVELFFILLREGIASTVVGKDVFQELEPTIRFLYTRGWDGSTISDWYTREQEKVKGKKHELGRLAEKVEIIQAFYSSTIGKNPLEECSKLFSGRGIPLSTIHRAKGLEAENVFILRPDLLPHPKAKKDWEYEQEKNLEYVAITRAKRSLYYVRND